MTPARDSGAAAAERPTGVVVAAPASGSGKTTVSAAIAASLAARGLRVQAFKTGPDFIDPGHLERASGRRARNLDGWMTGRRYVLDLVARLAADADVALLEGMMGLFDGVEPSSNRGSTAELAEWLGWPVVLVVDAGAAARSVAALVRGFRTFDPRVAVRAVIFNRVGGPGHLELLRRACRDEGVAVLGGLPALAELAVPERHLGLHQAGESGACPSPEALACAAEAHLDLDRLLEIAAGRAEGAVPVAPPSRAAVPPRPSRCRIAVARDEAFSFYYEDNLELLANAGAELILWSPLRDERLPVGVDGLYFGGGYPELYAERLASASALRAGVRRFAASGGMIYAECGGFMFLCDAIRGPDGGEAPMVGLFPGRAVVGRRLAAIGYVELDVAIDGAAHRARGHEFRYSDLEGWPDGACVEGEAIRRAYVPVEPHGAPCVGFAWRRVLAGWVHLHFGSAPGVASALVERAAAFRADNA